MSPDAAHLLPRDVATQFAHAAVQAIADQAGITILHVKGPVVDATLLAARFDEPLAEDSPAPMPRQSVDADILVAPSDARALLEAMTRHGWELAWDFDEGSLFAHAATLTHPHLAHVDVHRWFPGIECDPETAFAILASGARRIPIAGFPCLVPSDDAHRLVLLLHAARSQGGGGRADVAELWTRATGEEQTSVRRLADRLDATVALAAAIGELESVRHRRSYRLWRTLQRRDHTHREVLMGHIVAARPREIPALLSRFLLLNKRRMERQRGGAVGLRESLAGYRTWVSRRIRSR